ncbi:unnamed protein product [Caenorhabditis bovis]|uniref:SGNH domain-containing protein n=1 Tax=Caenorhabditis bovis TaxID=2654633 RepID=A0A8S1FCX2_9PELO|nr:unnamed protein product [Caenorhabditis bovis]
MYDECGQKAYAMVQGSAFSCEAIYPSFNASRCIDEIKAFKENIVKEKPDFGFMFSRFMSIGDPLDGNDTDIINDEIYKIMKANLDFYVKNIRKTLYILDAIPRVKRLSTRIIASKLRDGVFQKIIVDQYGWKLARKRYEQLFKDCGPKCVRIDYLPIFWNNSTQNVRYFDENGLEYQNGVNHLSPRGLEKIRHIYTEICNKL